MRFYICGNTKLFAKRKKELQKRSNIQYYEALFTEHDQHYILKNDIFYQVSDKNGALECYERQEKGAVKIHTPGKT